MRCVRYAFALTTLLAFLAIVAPRLATAGDYYYSDGDSYRSYRSPRHHDSSCCYRRVVRYERVHRDYDRPYYRSSNYYDRPDYRRSWTYNRPYYRQSNYGGYTSYSDPGYSYRSYHSSPSYRSYYSNPAYRYSGNGLSYNTRYSSYYNDQPRRFYPAGCRPVKYKIYDDGGGWVWGTRASCY